MNREEDDKKQSQRQDNRWVAIVLIFIGVIFLLRNLGVVQTSWFAPLISWQGALIGAGLISLFQRKYLPGVLLTFTGCYFLFPKLNEFVSSHWLTYWPVALIGFGLLILFSAKYGRKP